MSDHDKTGELVVKARSGDNEAIAEIYRRYGPRLLRIIRARLSPKLRRRIESGDLLQSAFATALRDLDLFHMREDGSLLHWLSVITTRKVAQIARSVGRERRNPEREVGIDAAALAQKGGVGPATQVAVDEEQRLMESALDQIHDPYREAILLRDYAGLEFEELARRLHRPSADAARKLHTKAKVMLAKAYGEMAHAAGNGHSDSSGTHTSRKPS